MLALVAPSAKLDLGRLLDLVGQWREPEILVLDVDEVRRVVHRLQVHRLDVALAVLRLRSQDLRHDRRVEVATQLELACDRRPPCLQLLPRRVTPCLAEVPVQVLEDGAGNPARHILARVMVVAPHLGMHARVTMIVTVPVRVERVVPHHEPHGPLRHLVVDQHHLLMMGRLASHRGGIGVLGERTAPGILALRPGAPGDLRALTEVEIARGEFHVGQGLVAQRVIADGFGKLLHGAARHQPLRRRTLGDVVQIGTPVPELVEFALR
ncbi:hypothetical protein GO283_05175 [Ralstonia solanacearum]|nr:hypothetical protein [Ralstonia solanacearum]